MSIAMRWVERPDGVVGRAYAQAQTLLEHWSRRGGNEESAAGLIGWPGVDLAERIAYELLLAQGYDEDLLDNAIDGGPFDNGMSAGDLDAEMEKTRSL